MSVKLQKEHIRLSEVVYSRYCQTTLENDIIVPDIKPDILKVLQVSNSISITQKNIQTDKIYIQGILRINILYTPDNDEPGSVKAINVSLDFNHTIDAKGAKPGMELMIESECDPAEYTPVNSRKLNIRSKVGFSIRLSQLSELDLATGIDDSTPIQLKGTGLKIYNPCVDAERDIIIREKFELPSGKPSICEVLKFTAKPVPVELRLLNDKAVTKGEIKACALYCSEENSIECLEYTAPFSEILEIDGLTEAMCGEIDYSVKDLYYEVLPDPDGDKRVLSCEITLSATVRAYETLECKAIEDAYSTNFAVELEKTAYNIEQFIDSTSAECALKEQVNIPDYLPEIHQLCDCAASLTVENVSIDASSVTVSGYANCNILYLATDSSAPVAGFNHIMSFSHTFDMPGITPDCLCDTKAEIQHISCTIANGRCLEIRAVVAIALKAMCPESTELISAIHCIEDETLPKPPSMIVYFVQKGDTLWNIAKRYHTPVDAIMEANNLDSDLILPGQRIFIFR